MRLSGSSSTTRRSRACGSSTSSMSNLVGSSSSRRALPPQPHAHCPAASSFPPVPLASPLSPVAPTTRQAGPAASASPPAPLASPLSPVAPTTRQAAELAKYKAVAVPSKTRFLKSGAFTSEVDLAIIRALQLGVSRGKMPALFLIFARIFDVTLPGRSKKVPGPHVDGKRTTVTRHVLYTPGATHVKHVAGMMYQLNKLLVGEWLVEHLESDETSCCYLADGAESQQVDYLGQLLARRVAGKLEIRALDLAALDDKTADAQAAAFRASLHEVAALMEKAGKADARAADLIRKFLPTCSMNDRASTARAAARKALGLDDGDNDPTCAEHGLVNILEEGRKAIDKVLRDMMNITDEQADGDAAKVKAMRTCVGWFSSPACALIYQVAKYVALASTKGYAIGRKFLAWLEARLADQEEQSAELLGHSEDLLAICGSRMYVFFLDAAPTERLISQEGSLLTYLQEEDDLGAEGGGKLRKSILTGCGSDACMAAVRTMALVCDVVLWPLLRAVKPAADKHTLDVLPVVWPTALAFFKAAAAAPASVVDGSLRLNLGDAPTASTASQATRSQRARIDMERIRSKAAGDPLVERLLAAAFDAMVSATENHAAEWLPGGKLSADKITPALREKYDALPSTSTSVERLHAIGRRVDDSGGVQRYENRAGISLAMFNDLASWAAQKGLALSGALATARVAERLARRQTQKARLVEMGRAKQDHPHYHHHHYPYHHHHHYHHHLHHHHDDDDHHHHHHYHHHHHHHHHRHSTSRRGARRSSRRRRRGARRRSRSRSASRRSSSPLPTRRSRVWRWMTSRTSSRATGCRGRRDSHSPNRTAQRMCSRPRRSWSRRSAPAATTSSTATRALTGAACGGGRWRRTTMCRRQVGKRRRQSRSGRWSRISVGSGTRQRSSTWRRSLARWWRRARSPAVPVLRRARCSIRCYGRATPQSVALGRRRESSLTLSLMIMRQDWMLGRSWRVQMVTRMGANRTARGRCDKNVHRACVVANMM